RVRDAIGLASDTFGLMAVPRPYDPEKMARMNLGLPHGDSANWVHSLRRIDDARSCRTARRFSGRERPARSGASLQTPCAQCRWTKRDVEFRSAHQASSLTGARPASRHDHRPWRRRAARPGHLRSNRLVAQIARIDDTKDGINLYRNLRIGGGRLARWPKSN